VIPLSVSFDHVGPLTNSVCDAGLVLQVLAGHDPEDKTTANIPIPDYTCDLEEPLPRLRMGIPRAFFFDDLDPEIAAAVEKAIQVFREMGVEIRDDIRLEVSTDRTLSSAESWAYHKEFVERSPELYQPATLTRIKSGEKLQPVEIERAKVELGTSRAAIGKVFEAVDVLLTPTVPIPPPLISELKQNPDKLRPIELLMLRNTRPFNVWGIPTISLPCGFTKSGLPIGLQLATAPWKYILLHVARQYERATDWHRRVATLQL
jgi:Asp-tRNA(Asn)/Glu-tRNA(Gln) amidotransferase A subunit family amidase